MCPQAGEARGTRTARFSLQVSNGGEETKASKLTDVGLQEKIDITDLA